LQRCPLWITAFTGFFFGNGNSAARGDLFFGYQWMGAGVRYFGVIWLLAEPNPLHKLYLVKGIQVVIEFLGKE